MCLCPCWYGFVTVVLLSVSESWMLYFYVRKYWPKAGQYGSFPRVFGSNLCPLSPILRACLLVYFSWCGRTSLHCCQLCQLSVKEKTGLGSCGEETLLWNPAHPLVLRCFIKVSSLMSMRWCPLRPLSAICDSLYCSKPHGFNESLKAATPSAP